jgi:3-hydroxyisobutyrate dehydrogenase-like beta-hydroxyacid dehydrogenase
LSGLGTSGAPLAGDLASREAGVRLFNRSGERLAPIRKAGGTTVTGEVEGFADEAVQCPTPVISAITQLAGVLTGIDYARARLTIEQMGLTGKNEDEIRAYAG